MKAFWNKLDVDLESAFFALIPVSSKTFWFCGNSVKCLALRSQAVLGFLACSGTVHIKELKGEKVMF